jgi:hypothetical protein
MGIFIGACERKGAARGETLDGKSPDAQLVGYLRHVIRPIEQPISLVCA